MQKMMGLMRKCIDDYHMISAGDKIAVGVSGGKDSLTLLAVLAALRALRIGEPVEERATDSDDLFLFTLDDGTTCSVAFEAHRLNTGDARYIVENGGALWKLAASILEPEA